MLPIRVMKKGASGGGAGGGAVIARNLPTSGVADPADANAIFALNSSGVGNSSGEANWNWRLSGVSADYEARCTPAVGGFSTGDSTGVWLNLCTSRYWARNRIAVGSVQTEATVEIRVAATGVVVAYEYVYWYAEVF
jgi:hypothetical protein